jgi:hypothetical protein
LLWLAGLALVALALLLTDRLLWAPGLTEDNVRRIRPGLTLAEVEALLGGPAGDTFEMPADYPAYRWQREWREGGEVVVVQFTADGKVMSAAGQGGRGPASSPASAPGWAGDRDGDQSAPVGHMHWGGFGKRRQGGRYWRSARGRGGR